MNNDNKNNNMEADMTEQEVAQVSGAVELSLLEKAAELVRTLQAEIDALKAAPKNQRPGKAMAKNSYILLSKELKMWGKVPQQQQDLAKLLASHMEVGKEYSEAEVFTMLVDGSGEYRSICTSKQDPTYLFKYYRSLKNDGKYAGFIGREFLRMV